VNTTTKKKPGFYWHREFSEHPWKVIEVWETPDGALAGITGMSFVKLDLPGEWIRIEPPTDSECDCGDSDPWNVVTCVGCGATGCDSCEHVDWCCCEYDDSDGEYFCKECRTNEPEDIEDMGWGECPPKNGASH